MLFISIVVRHWLIAGKARSTRSGKREVFSAASLDCQPADDQRLPTSSSQLLVDLTFSAAKQGVVALMISLLPALFISRGLGGNKKTTKHRKENGNDSPFVCFVGSASWEVGSRKLEVRNLCSPIGWRSKAANSQLLPPLPFQR